MSAVPRANHMVRMLAPSKSLAYAAQHDDAIWGTFCEMIGAGDLHADLQARAIATLPGRLSGLGLRSAVRSAAGAYWASWADTLPVIRDRLPELARDWLSRLGEARPPACLAEAEQIRGEMVAQGAALPTWAEVLDGAQPPPPAEGLDAADFDRGWQCHACSFAENSFREQVVLPSADESRRALLHSQAGGAASAWLRAIPSEQALRMTPLRFQTAIRRRLRWPLPLSGGLCCRGCKTELDKYGDRAAACGMSGRIKARGGHKRRRGRGSYAKRAAACASTFSCATRPCQASIPVTAGTSRSSSRGSRSRAESLWRSTRP